MFVSPAAVPERPEDLIITAITKDSISVTWRPPKYDGGADVTSYVLESRMIGHDNFVRVGGEDKLMDRRFTLAGLKEGSSHEFRVSAVNQVGQGKPSFATKPVQCKDELGKWHNMTTFILSEKLVTHQCENQGCNYDSTLLMRYNSCFSKLVLGGLSVFCHVMT